MRNLAFLTLLATTFSQPVWALQQTNCETKDQTLVRIENEVWGSNEIYWEYKNQRFEENEVTLLKRTKKIQTQRSVEWMGTESQETIYTMDVQLPDRSVHTILCKELVNQAID